MQLYFGHEKLDVYKLALEFISWVTKLIDEINEVDKSKIREVRNHLDRASLSIVFNTAEGNGKRQSKARSAFFDIARGSAMECSACLDVLVAKGVCTDQRILEGKSLLLRIVSILSKLIIKFDPSATLKDVEELYTFENENENDNDCC
jgi:four helix bundle protein